MTQTQTINFTATAVLKTYDHGALEGDIGVDIVFNEAGVDRPHTHGWCLGSDTPARRKLAARLMAAIEAGVVETDLEIHTDVFGGTYVSGQSHVYGRTVNADLKRLGF